MGEGQWFKLVRPAIHLLVWPSLGLVALQLGLSPVGPLGAVRSWDLATKLAIPGATFTRPTGAFLNPNDLAWTALVALVLFSSAVDRRKGDSAAAMACGFLILASGSRGYLLAAIAVGAARELGFGRASRSAGQGQLRISKIGVVLAGALLAVTVISPIAQFLQDRVRLSDVASFAGDPSLTGRADQYDLVRTLVAQYPLGQLKPPQLAAGSSIDSEFGRALVQGGFLQGLLLVGAFGVTIARARRSARAVLEPGVGVALAAFVASSSQLPLSGAAMPWFYLTLGTVSTVAIGVGKGVSKNFESVGLRPRYVGLG
jgi:hypothetical protein